MVQNRYDSTGENYMIPVSGVEIEASFLISRKF